MFNGKSDYVTVNVTSGVQTVSNQNGVLTLSVTDADSYTVSVKLNDTKNWKWKGIAETAVPFSIYVGTAGVAKPYITDDATGLATEKECTFNNTEIEFSVSGVTDIMEYELSSELTLKSYQNDVLVVTAINAGTHTVKVTLKHPENYSWLGGGNGELNYKLKVGKLGIAVPEITGDTSVVYDGEYKYITVNAEGYDLLNVTWSCTNSTVKDSAYELKKVSWENGVYKAKVIQAGTYTINFEHVNTGNTYWDNDKKTTTKIAFTYTVAKGSIEEPTVDGKKPTDKVLTVSKDYTGQYIDFVLTAPKAVDALGNPMLKYTVSEGLTLVSQVDGVSTYRALNAKSYTVTVGLSSTTNLSWNTTSTYKTSDRTYTFKISKGKISAPVIEGDSVVIEDAVTKSYPYTGNYQQFVLTNIIKTVDAEGN
ncbi:MAG: hypothetical protein K2K04_05970, partial [Clostridia bacterium]|nr:hypothetical protein [Clostridia bacterium]